MLSKSPKSHSLTEVELGLETRQDSNACVLPRSLFFLSEPSYHTTAPGSHLPPLLIAPLGFTVRGGNNQSPWSAPWPL